MNANEPASMLAKEFERETIAKAITDTRLAAIAASVAFPLFNILDYFIYPHLYFSFLAIRAVVVALSMIIFSLARTKLGKRHPRELGMLEYIICCLSISLMVHMTGDTSSPFYAGINLVLIVFLAMMPLDLKRTAIISAIVYTSYLAPMIAFRRITDFPIFMNNNFFLLATIVLVNLSAHLAAQLRFREFSARFSLAQANEELKKLDLLKSQFFANVSHEVRTPLTSIIGPLQSLYQGDLGSLAPDQQRMLGQMYRNALKLLDMINQMLDFSKLEAGKMQLRLSRVDLNEMVRDIVSLFEDVTKRKGLQLAYAKESDVPPVYLDTDKIERILTNLIRNAIKFTDRGFILVRVGKDTYRIFFEVEDTGIGIPMEHLPNIFKRFQQVDSSSTRRYEGTGLGLTIVKESVELMRGNITASSEVGKGSKFRVELPENLEQLAPDAFIERRATERRRSDSGYRGLDRRRDTRRSEDPAKVTVPDMVLIERLPVTEAEEQEVQPEQPIGEGAERVLLVEDNADLRNYILRMLTRFGHQVSTAVDGVDGWEQAQNSPPDLIVSDVMMPRMDGYELLRKIKSNAKTKHIPFILVTAKPELESKIEGLEIGADDYLAKPVNIRELDARIRNLITMRKFQLALAREDELNVRMEELSMSFSQSLEIRDFKTAGHSRDVLNLGSIIAEGLGIPMDRKLKDSLLLHDIGKLGIPDRILLKESALDDGEWAIMKKHPELGANLLGHFESYREISSVILAHQEHFDGTGYPNGLKGEEIPLVARIIAIADAYHAMTSNRPYRKALSPRVAVSELLRNSGRQFDPRLVDIFIQGLLKRGLVSQYEINVAKKMID